MKFTSRQQKAKLFKSKAALVGIEFDYLPLDNDRVCLTRYKVLGSKNITIPSFVTDSMIFKTRQGNKDIYIGSLYETDNTEVYIDNDSDAEFNAFGLCEGMLSEELKVHFKNPDKVTNMRCMFIWCRNL